jgi:C4-type Zn-finger protein
MEFHDIGLPNKTEAERIDPKTASDDEITPFLGSVGVMRAFVKDCSFRSKDIVLPHRFDQMQRGPPLAELDVRKAGKRKKVVFGERIPSSFIRS